MFGLFKKSKPAETQSKEKPASKAQRAGVNPFRTQTRSFYSGEVGRLLDGWVTSSASIDQYLRFELPTLRARTREACRQDPFAKRIVSLMKTNIVGPKGVSISARSMFNGELDSYANTAIEAAFRDFCKGENFDYKGRLSFKAMQDLAISNAVTDGEFIIRVWMNRGKYGVQFELIDPELLDVTRTQTEKNGNVTRCGVGYDQDGRRARYYFRKRDAFGNYLKDDGFDVPASAIIHAFVDEWPDQSRGIPWLHASLERMKHLNKFDEAAMVAARSGASKAGFIRRDPDAPADGDDEFLGDEAGEGKHQGYSIDNVVAGSVQDIGTAHFESYDPSYPHALYKDFVKTTLRAITAGVNLSYPSTSNDLEGVNYSSIRAGLLEDREVFKCLQNWFIEIFVSRVWKEYIFSAVNRQMIVLPNGRALNRNYEEYLAAYFQGRRWAWVDPQKDGAANHQALEDRLKSRTRIAQEQGDDIEDIFAEIKTEAELMAKYNIKPAQDANQPNVETDDEEDE